MDPIRAEDASRNPKGASAMSGNKLEQMPRRLAQIAAVLASSAALCLPVAGHASNATDKGRTIFNQNCVSCHGENGKAQVNVMSHAADLTDPDTWKRGHSDADIFNAIKNGGSESMPPFKAQLSDDQIWLLVAFIKSLWTATGG
jgi:cbb3-type cytochrome c oxidase subunit III